MVGDTRAACLRSLRRSRASGSWRCFASSRRERRSCATSTARSRRWSTGPRTPAVPPPTRQVLETLSDRFGLVACISGRAGRGCAADGRPRCAHLHRQPRARASGARGRRARGRSRREAARRPRAARSPYDAFRRPGAGRRRAARGQGRDLGLPLARRSRPRRRPRAARAGRGGGPGGRPRPALGAHGARDPPDGHASTRAPPSPPPSPARRSAPRCTAATTRRTSTPSGGCAHSRPRGRWSSAVCVGVASPDGPAEIAAEADLVVGDPDELLRAARPAGGLTPGSACPTPTSSSQP